VLGLCSLIVSCKLRGPERGGLFLRKLIEKALQDHLDEQGELTGFMLITFRDGEAMVTAEAQEGDAIAQEVIGGIEAALLNPECACDDADDEIGICAGHA
jgi:hypothetical protein